MQDFIHPCHSKDLVYQTLLFLTKKLYKMTGNEESYKQALFHFIT
jgi:hypothetical protein